MKQHTYLVTEEFKNLRIDVYLTKVNPDNSRSFFQHLLNNEEVLVNTKKVKANYKVQPEDLILVTYDEPKESEIIAEDIPLNIVYEDEHLIVVNKARGMVVHPAAGNFDGTLVNALLGSCKDLSGINGVMRPGIVHRLDKDTSGVMVVAKNDCAHLSLAEQIKAKTASRIYIAIVNGIVKEDRGIINAPIGRHPKDRKKMAVVFQNSKEAITQFEVIERIGKYTIVECKLLTGRTHQIRVHMAYIGYPVVGDPLYGPAKCEFNISGQALHAKKLSFVHPITKMEMSFEAPLPQDMKDIIEYLKKRYKVM